ncbi:MAG: hypothetical protein JOZ41_15060 [Chloroflexi bacterium]|nr:hypothetical protein [Chloroflexota bacterium]
MYAPEPPSGVGKAPTAGYGEECFGARHDGSRFSLGATEALEFVAFLVGEGA